MRKTVLLFILCLLLSFGACSKEPISVKKPAIKQAAPVAAQQQQQQTVETKDETKTKFYAYDPRGKRDPFLSLIKTTKAKEKKRRPDAPPIESFSVDEISLLAIASDKDEGYALVLLPNNKTYTIKKGTVLGLEGGKVEEISEDKIVIREFVKDYLGNVKPKDTVLKLHKGEE